MADPPPYTFIQTSQLKMGARACALVCRPHQAEPITFGFTVCRQKQKLSFNQLGEWTVEVSFWFQDQISLSNFPFSHPSSFSIIGSIAAKLHGTIPCSTHLHSLRNPDIFMSLFVCCRWPLSNDLICAPFSFLSPVIFKPSQGKSLWDLILWSLEWQTLHQKLRNLET